MYQKYKHQIHFLFFGVLTTLVNIGIYYIMTEILMLSNIVGTIIAWVGAILFAYMTNRRWVFESDAQGITAILQECGRFIAARALTGGLDLLIMWVGVDVLDYNGLMVKALADVVVIILNYVFSKIIVFRYDEKKS